MSDLITTSLFEGSARSDRLEHAREHSVGDISVLLQEGIAADEGETLIGDMDLPRSERPGILWLERTAERVAEIGGVDEPAGHD